MWAGKFPFAQIFRCGTNEVVGWGVTCGRHTNANGECSGTPCKKSVSKGKDGVLSEEEAAKRLKRWLIAGHVDKLNPNCMRQSHVAGWDELDPDLDILLQQC